MLKQEQERVFHTLLSAITGSVGFYLVADSLGWKVGLGMLLLALYARMGVYNENN